MAAVNLSGAPPRAAARLSLPQVRRVAALARALYCRFCQRDIGPYTTTQYQLLLMFQQDSSAWTEKQLNWVRTEFPSENISERLKALLCTLDLKCSLQFDIKPLGRSVCNLLASPESVPPSVVRALPYIGVSLVALMVISEDYTFVVSSNNCGDFGLKHLARLHLIPGYCIPNVSLQPDMLALFVSLPDSCTYWKCTCSAINHWSYGCCPENLHASSCAGRNLDITECDSAHVRVDNWQYPGIVDSPKCDYCKFPREACICKVATLQVASHKPVSRNIAPWKCKCTYANNDGDECGMCGAKR
jgi:hypothetical protein